MVIPAGQEKIGTRALLNMVNYSVVVNNPVGLHARPAADFVKTANQFTSSVKVRNATRGTALINGKSMLKVLTLGAEKGHELELEFEGEDEQAAFQAIQALFDSNFGE
jgi:phosphotransferase system HPr (HPr) family protein